MQSLRFSLSSVYGFPKPECEKISAVGFSTPHQSSVTRFGEILKALGKIFGPLWQIGMLLGKLLCYWENFHVIG